MKENIIVEVVGVGKKIIKAGSTISELLKQIDTNDYIVAAEMNNEIVELSEELTEDLTLRFVSCSERIGSKIYQNGLKYLFIVAVYELYGTRSIVEIKHSLDKGIYSEIKINKAINEDVVKEIKAKMTELAKKDLKIEKISTSRKSAIKYFEDTEQTEKVKMYKQMTSDHVTLYQLLNYYNYFYSQMPDTTGRVSKFDLTFIPPKGILLSYPLDNNKPIPKYSNSDAVLKEFRLYEQWSERVGVKYACDINELLIKNKIGDFIKLNEMRQQRDIEHIASTIEKRKEIRLILIGGPSSSGKTTISKKLSLCLKERGINPFVISTDNYFRDKSNYKYDENGEADLDSIDSIELKLLNENLTDLLIGKEVSMPIYNFMKGEKEYPNPPLKLRENTIIIIEGLHTLNEKLTSSIERNLKYKIYISPFTPLNLDRHNHISTVDLRLLRRIVRDYYTRNTSADETFNFWKKVRAKEEKYIYPYQNDNDIVLNTALIHEIGMIEMHALPLLFSIKEDSPNYAEAIRMLKFLKCFFAIPTKMLPDTSILREFIGDSYFE